MSDIWTAVRSGCASYKDLWRNGGIDTDWTNNNFEEEEDQI